MATAGDGRAPYESSGAGGKFRKRPFRRSAQATPYDRPPTALRNNNPGLLTKLVDPASRLIYAGAHKLFDVFRKRLPPLSLQGPPEINEEPQNVSHDAGRNNSIVVSKLNTHQEGNAASISNATGISDLEQMLKQKTFTRSEIQHLTELLHSRTTESPSENIVERNAVNIFEEETPSPADMAKSYMGTRPTKLSPSPLGLTTQDSKLINYTTTLQKTSITPKTSNKNNFKNLENGFLTPRSRGRSAMYSMARTPYTKSPILFNQKEIMSTSSQSLKRRSSVLDDDFGSGGPLRRTRQKPNLLLNSRDKKELGYTTFQQPILLKNKPEETNKSIHVSVPEKSTQTATKIFQQLERMTPKSPTKLTSNMLHGQALRSLEKVDPPKFVPTSHDVKKPEIESTRKGKEKVEENGEKKFLVPFNMLTNGKSDMGVCIKENTHTQIVTIDDDDLSSKVLNEPPLKKRAFQMSAPEDLDDDDDDNDNAIHVNGLVSFPLLENNKPETISADIIEPPTPPEVLKIPAAVEATPVVVPPEATPVVAKSPEKVEFKESEKATPPPPLKTDGFFGGNVIEQETGFKFPNSQSTPQKDEITPTEKVSPFQFLGNEVSETKPKTSSDTKRENGNEQKLENNFTSGVFSFASSAKNSSGPTVVPDSSPAIVSSLGSFSASGGNTVSVLNNNTSSEIAPVSASISTSSVFSTSLPPPVFSFGSSKPTSNTDAVNEKKPESTISSSLFAPATTTTPSGGGGLFGFSSPAATSITTTTNGGGALFGFSSPAATSTATTTTTTGGALFGFSSLAAPSTTTTTTTGGALFGFSSSATTSTTTAAATTNGGALFGFSSPATTSTTAAAATTNGGGALFGFSSAAATSTATTTTTTPHGGALVGFGSTPATSTTTTGGTLFGFSSSAATSTTTTAAATASNSLFGFSSPAATSTATTQSQSSFFNAASGSQSNTQTSTPVTQTVPFQFSSTSSLFGSSTPAFGSTSSITATSESKSGNSTSGPTTSIFGSSWQPQNSSVFSFGASSATTSPITFGTPPPTTTASTSSMFSFTTSGPTKPSFTTPSQVFGTPAPVFANNNDQMSMEDSMAEDSMQTPSPSPVFGQPAPVAATPGFMFGSAAPAPPQPAAPFQFGGPPSQVAPPQNPFQSSSVEFNGGGGSFSLGTGGDKSGRRIVRVNKSKNRRK